MREITLYQALILFSWFPLGFVLAVTMLIGRFYARFSGRRTYWPYLALSMVLYAAATVREARIGAPGDPLADFLQAAAGVGVLLFVIRLYRWMMRGSPAVLMPTPPPVALATLPVIGAAALGVIGPMAMAVVLWTLGRLSHRMHHILQGRSYYYGYYLASGMVALAALIRLPVILNPDWALTYAVLMSLGCGLGAMMSWRAWSWLLAERE